MTRIILASTSPRRQEMLAWLGIKFDIASSGVDEELIRNKDPAKLALLLADAKAMAVARKYTKGLVIGSDTVIALHDRIIEKAANVIEQRALILSQLNQCPEVISGVCVIDAATGKLHHGIKITRYCVADVPRNEVEAYIASGLGLDKGGGFGLQDKNGLFLKKLDGCYTNLIGLPLCTVDELLAELGYVTNVDVKTVVKAKTGKGC